MPDARKAYEAAVIALGEEARRSLASGESAERIARRLAIDRNRLKLAFRVNDPPASVAFMERRNRAKYGDPSDRRPSGFSRNTVAGSG